MRRYRIKAAVVAAAAALLTASGGSAIAAPADPGATAERTAEGTANAGTPVPLPDLAFAHRRGDGGINLFRMSLSELEVDFGTPQLVRSLTAKSGFLFDRARVVAGDVANFTAGDDGTADHVLLIPRTDGGIGVWVVPGGSDTTPRQQAILRASAGWSWVKARPDVGDVTGDGWDDLVIRQRSGSTQAVVWVLPSTGSKLGAPKLWERETVGLGGADGGRTLLGDYDGDSDEDRIVVNQAPPFPGLAKDIGIFVRPHRSSGSAFTGPGQISSQDLDVFYFKLSRNVVGDVDGDGLSDLVTVHRSGRGGLNVFSHLSMDYGGLASAMIGPPALWQVVGGTWSFDYSRQYMADTDADGLDDLISVHRTPSGGMAVYRHLSDGASFAAPELIKTLPAGWNWSLSRESAADTWGVVGP